jgi:hypothetical protein
MASQTVDFKKVDSAFQHLADSPEGNKALENLNSALNQVSKTAGSDLNSNETHYLLTNLVQQKQGGTGSAALAAAPGARVKSGFVIKTSVE